MWACSCTGLAVARLEGDWARLEAPFLEGIDLAARGGGVMVWLAKC